jgi:hypothetical protein
MAAKVNDHEPDPSITALARVAVKPMYEAVAQYIGQLSSSEFAGPNAFDTM